MFLPLARLSLTASDDFGLVFDEFDVFVVENSTVFFPALAVLRSTTIYYVFRGRNRCREVAHQEPNEDLELVPDPFMQMVARRPTVNST